ncbi:MAG: BRCT domain-containing protein, partial [Planctomycetota bacterium]
ETAKRQTTELLETLSPKYLNLNTDDPNTTGLVRVVAKLKTILDNAVEQATEKQQQNQELQNRFDDTVATNIEKEKTLLAEKEKYQQEVNSIKTDYADLKTLMEQTSEQQVQTLATQLDIQKTTNKRLNQDMLKTQAELKIAENRIKHIQQKFQALVPPPDVEVAAFKADGEVILIDPQANIVHLNLGRQDRIYQGLTFSVYEKNMPIPKDGKGKAEVEVFNVGESISAARIIRSEISRPIVLDDIIANLIWDADKANIFVVAGDFDLDSDKSPDYNGPEKIATLVERWGGVVKKDVSIDTDFLILGELPDIPRKPTFEQLEVDPMAMDKYDALIERLTRYRQVKKQADTLSIPIFNTERFLYFAGYREQAKRPGAF